MGQPRGWQGLPTSAAVVLSWDRAREHAPTLTMHLQRISVLEGHRFSRLQRAVRTSRRPTSLLRPAPPLRAPAGSMNGERVDSHSTMTSPLRATSWDGPPELSDDWEPWGGQPPPGTFYDWVPCSGWGPNVQARVKCGADGMPIAELSPLIGDGFDECGVSSCLFLHEQQHIDDYFDLLGGTLPCERPGFCLAVNTASVDWFECRGNRRQAICLRDTLAALHPFDCCARRVQFALDRNEERVLRHCLTSGSNRDQ